MYEILASILRLVGINLRPRRLGYAQFSTIVGQRGRLDGNAIGLVREAAAALRTPFTADDEASALAALLPMKAAGIRDARERVIARWTKLAVWLGIGAIVAAIVVFLVQVDGATLLQWSKVAAHASWVMLKLSFIPAVLGLLAYFGGRILKAGAEGWKRFRDMQLAYRASATDAAAVRAAKIARMFADAEDEL